MESQLNLETSKHFEIMMYAVWRADGVSYCHWWYLATGGIYLVTTVTKVYHSILHRGNEPNYISCHFLQLVATDIISRCSGVWIPSHIDYGAISNGFLSSRNILTAAWFWLYIGFDTLSNSRCEIRLRMKRLKWQITGITYHPTEILNYKWYTQFASPVPLLLSSIHFDHCHHLT